MHEILRIALALLFFLAGTPLGLGALIVVSPLDTPKAAYSKIEAAKAGDEVSIAPGTYRFRVYLSAQGTASQPINIHAQDPGKPPVWDLSAGLVEDAPGSYPAGDRGRAAWQLFGASNHHISGIVFTGSHNGSRNAAGIRY